jgi:hypothetical protein
VQVANLRMVVFRCSRPNDLLAFAGSDKTLPEARYTDMNSVNIIAYMLSGNVNLSGKLLFTFPLKLEDALIMKEHTSTLRIS